MRVLQDVTPRPEQIKIVQFQEPGVVVIKGAAGSGKTTTALLRLRVLAASFENRRERYGDDTPVRILVLTYNRTLKGYIEALATAHTPDGTNSIYDIRTFSNWAVEQLNYPKIVDDDEVRAKINELACKMDLEPAFVADEVEYVLGRFPTSDLDQYLTTERTGRGLSPRMDQARRQALLDNVIHPFNQWKKSNNELDWNDLAEQLSNFPHITKYDIIIADEAQDFSANQLRAISKALAEEYSLTFVLDTAQRIYARGFTWKEAGISVSPEHSHRLNKNYRNTSQIARFAAPLLEGISIDDDGSIPNFETCKRNGPLPVVVTGYYNQQVSYAINFIKEKVDLRVETVGILHVRGGGVFNYIRQQFNQNELENVTITRRSEWPDGPENIAFCTMHSAKGLEFDHVFILGLSEEFTPHGTEADDDRLTSLRRLLAMGIGRSRSTVTIGYKPGEESILVKYFDPKTFEKIEL